MAAVEARERTMVATGARRTLRAPRAIRPEEGAAAVRAASVAVDEYLDAQPLTRQARAMKRQGLVVMSQVLWDQIDALAEVLEPCY